MVEFLSPTKFILANILVTDEMFKQKTLCSLSKNIILNILITQSIVGLVDKSCSMATTTCNGATKVIFIVFVSTSSSWNTTFANLVNDVGIFSVAQSWSLIWTWQQI